MASSVARSQFNEVKASRLWLVLGCVAIREDRPAGAVTLDPFVGVDFKMYSIVF